MSSLSLEVFKQRLHDQLSGMLSRDCHWVGVSIVECQSLFKILRLYEAEVL